jgi:hypothetical protein
MKLVEITNLFNLVTRIHPHFMNYHMGWPSDMARNVQNNYDPTQTTGTLYPAVLISPPEIKVNPNDLKTTYFFRVHFLELQGYLNTTEARIHTKVEQWSDLFEKGLQWLREVQNANKQLTKPAYIGLKNDNLQGGLMESASQRKLIYVYFDMEVITSSTCTDLGLTYPDDINAVGYDWPPTENYDLENIYNYSGDLIDDGITLPPNAIGTGFFEQAFVSQATDTMTVTVNDLPSDPAQIWVYYDNGQVLSRNYWSKSGNNITLTFTPPIAQTIWIKFYA